MADELGDDLAEFAAGLDAVVEDAMDDVPLNADQANRMLRKRRSVARHGDEIRERYDAEAKMLQAWRDDRLRGVEYDIAFLDRALEGWMRGQYEMTGVVTEKLPAGDLWLRQPQASVVVVDEPAAIRTLDALKEPAAIKVTESLLKSEAAKIVVPGDDPVEGDAGPDHEYRLAHYREKDGPVIEGIVLRVPARRTFSVHPNEEHYDDHGD